MSKVKNIFEEKMETKNRIHEELFNKEKKALEEKIKSKKYDTELMIARSSLGGTYHDLLDGKDKLNSQYHSQLNRGLHTVDVELYKLNQRLDNQKKMVEYKINQKKEAIDLEIRKNM